MVKYAMMGDYNPRCIFVVKYAMMATIILGVFFVVKYTMMGDYNPRCIFCGQVCNDG